MPDRKQKTARKSKPAKPERMAPPKKRPGAKVKVKAKSKPAAKPARQERAVPQKAAPAPDGLLVRRPIEPVVGSEEDFRIGYVALVGRPNVGKSTILNQLLGQKIAATTHKPQTTRKNLLGVLHPKGAQLLLLDTPGYHS